MKKKLLLPLIILSIVLVSCSKEISINDLESKDSVAYDPDDGIPGKI